MKTIDEEISSKFTTEQARAAVNLMYTSNWYKDIQIQLLKPFDLTIQQYNILRILRGSSPGKLAMQEIVCRMLDKSPNATRLADKLIKKGYVKRTASTIDRRVIYLTINDKGLELMKELEITFIRPLSETIGKLNDEQAAKLSELLDILRA